MKKTILTMMLTALVLSVGAQNKYKQYTENLPFKMAEMKAPVIPDAKVSLSDFGAVGTGDVLCTDAFAKAIDQLYKMGGGHLVVPRGLWLTGPLRILLWL